MRIWYRPRDDRELEQQLKLKPPDHAWTSSAQISKLERKMLGDRWFKPRKPPEAK